jgi:hypothetical protein
VIYEPVVPTFYWTSSPTEFMTIGNDREWVDENNLIVHVGKFDREIGPFHGTDAGVYVLFDGRVAISQSPKFLLPGFLRSRA